MSEIKTFFRYCPSCGKRFHIRLVRKEMVSVEREPKVAEKAVAGVEDQVSGFAAPIPLLLEEGKPITVDLESYQYIYRCKHCGHEWSEMRVKEEKEKE